MGEAFEVGVEKGWIYGWYVCNYRSKGEESEVPGHICQRGMDALCFFVLVLLVPLVPGGVGGVTFLSRPEAGSDFFFQS